MHKQQIPWLMAAARMTLGPIMVLGQRAQWSGLTLAALVITALLSDIFDGVLARRWHCDTNGIRLFDTLADTVFYIGTTIALYLHRPELFHAHATLLLAIILFEAARYAFDFAKFGKPASYHSYIAKTWGLILASAIITTFATTHGNTLFLAALWAGIVCNIEGLIMSLILPQWHCDVKTLSAALRLRMMDTVSLSDRAREVFRSTEKKRVFPRVIVALGVILTLAVPAFAGYDDEAIYVRGSIASGPSDSVGTLDTTVPTALLFHAAHRNAEISIPYQGITTYRYECVPAHHLGFFPAMFVGMVRPSEKKHLVTIDYTDANNIKQVAEFEVNKREPRFLLELLHQRTDTTERGDSICH